MIADLLRFQLAVLRLLFRAASAKRLPRFAAVRLGLRRLSA